MTRRHVQTTGSDSGVDAVVRLADVDRRHQQLEFVFAFFNRALLVLLALTGLMLTLCAISPADFIDALTTRGGPLLISQRLALAAGALLTGAATAALNKRLNDAWFWFRLPGEGSITVTRKGLCIRHAAVLDGDVLIAWPNIKVIALDSGAHHDKALAWRRFPLPSAGRERSYLFATDGELRPNFALIAARPVAPNVAILFNDPVPLRNPNAALTAVTFPRRAQAGLPAHPPAGDTLAAGLFLRTANLGRTRRVLMPTGKLRALRIDDLN